MENPYTSDKGLLVVLVIATGVTGLGIILVTKNKFAKYTIFVIALSSSLVLNNSVNAGEISELPITLNVSFESQNVMSEAYEYDEICHDWNGDGVNDNCYNSINYLYFWEYGPGIKNIYIENEIKEIENYAYKFDVTEEQNGRVTAYLVESKEDSLCSYEGVDGFRYTVECYDLYLQADGIIYPNENSSYYFAETYTLEGIYNFEGFDTSNVTNMSHMFYYTGASSESLILDLNSFDTSKVTDIGYMFYYTGRYAETIRLDLSNFDTSKVTDMSYMFNSAGYNSTKLNTSITIKNPNITSYDSMFHYLATKEGSQITVNYTSETDALVSNMITAKSEDSNVVKGDCIECGEGYISIGTKISIGEEEFNVISQTDDTVTKLAQYNIGTDYRQSENENRVTFSDTGGWEYTPGPKEIDIQTW